MKKPIKITLLALLSTSIGLQAAVFTTGCWMPESDTVKNHYKGKDGGYLIARALYKKNPKNAKAATKNRARSRSC